MELTKDPIYPHAEYQNY